MLRLPVVIVLIGAVVVLATGAAGSGAAASRRAGTIAFIRMANDKVYGGRIFVIRADGSGLRPVTPPSTRVDWYAWSPDGKLIAYIDQRGSLSLVRPDGTGRRLLLPAWRLSSLGLSWSPDGSEIAVVSPGAGVAPSHAGCGMLALYAVPVDGAKPVLVSRPRRGIGCGVAWSPDGGEIAYADGGEVLGVISRNGGRPRLLLASGVGAPQWSPDGTKLAAPTVIHLAGLRSLRYRRITVVDADGGDPHVLTDHAYTEYPFAWSPDSKHILYGRQDGQGIYVIDSDGRNNRRVTSDAPPEAGWGALAWSPSGASIVYTHTVGTNYNTNLYVIGVDGRDKVQLTNTGDIDIDPSWVAR